MKRIIFLLMACVTCLAPGLRGDGTGAMELDLRDGDGWHMVGAETELVSYLDTPALRINPGPWERLVYARNLEFTDGVIELDIAAVPSFTGLVFRVQSGEVYEGIYFRPQNSRHSDSVKRGHAVQYIAAPRYTWYYLREKFPEKYEAAVDLPPGEWFHVRVEVAGRTARVFVNDAAEPCLVVDDLKHGVSRGSVGVWCGNTSGGTFANLTVSPADMPDDAPAAGPVTYSAEQEYLFDLFRTRRSVRRFRPDPVPAEHVVRILDMARTAPTSGNQQPWKFLVIQDRERLDQLRDACVARTLGRYKASGVTDPARLEAVARRSGEVLGNYLSAPVYVAVLVDKGSAYPDYNVYDGSLAAGYLLLAARALGYGTVFITDAVPFDAIREIFAVPDQFEFICFTPIGVPEEWPEPRGKKPLGEFLAFEQLMPGTNYVPWQERKTVELTAAELDGCAGRYRFAGLDLVMDVYVENGRLLGRITGQDPLELQPASSTEFFARQGNVDITFQRNDPGRATGLTLRQGGRTFEATRED